MANGHLGRESHFNVMSHPGNLLSETAVSFGEDLTSFFDTVFSVLSGNVRYPHPCPMWLFEFYISVKKSSHGNEWSNDKSVEKNPSIYPSQISCLLRVSDLLLEERKNYPHLLPNINNPDLPCTFTAIKSQCKYKRRRFTQA